MEFLATEPIDRVYLWISHVNRLLGGHRSGKRKVRITRPKGRTRSDFRKIEKLKQQSVRYNKYVEEMWKQRKARLEEYVAYYESEDGIPPRQPPPSLFDPLPLKEDLYINVIDELLPRTQLFPDEPTESEPGSPVTTTPQSEEGVQPGSPVTTSQEDLLDMLSGQFPSQPPTASVTWHVH